MVTGELIAHVQNLCDKSEQPLANVREHFEKLLALQSGTPPAIQGNNPIISELVGTILTEFETASIANYLGDSFLFYKYFTSTLLHAISLHAWLKGMPDWQNPPNYLNQVSNEVERKFLGGLFPEINQEIANWNKRDFIDWFGEVLDELGGKMCSKNIPLSVAQINQSLRGIYRRDYLVNFRPVEHLRGIFRSPNPAKFILEVDLLERYFAEHKISLIIDLRGELEAHRSAYVEDILKKQEIKAMLVDFNEPNSNEIVGSGYKKKAHFLKNEVKKVFRAILGNSGATLIHCASGKDRTGIIAALLQKLAGVPDPEILAEYQRSGLDTRPEKLHDVLHYVEEQGGIQHYLELCGFSSHEQEVLATKIKE